jgi:hypothetical protein
VQDTAGLINHEVQLLSPEGRVSGVPDTLVPTYIVSTAPVRGYLEGSFKVCAVEMPIIWTAPPLFSLSWDP